MYTSFVLAVLTGGTVVPAAETNLPSWHRDYAEAYQLGSEKHKPLAVFLSPGAMGWQKVVKEGEVPSETEKLLREHYVCVYIDTSKTSGAQLADSFEMPEGTGLVLSDHTGKAQAFRHAGELSVSDLDQTLRKYADPWHIVRRTESQEQERVSNYAPPAPVMTPTFAPQPLMFGGFGGFGGGGGGC